MTSALMILKSLLVLLLFCNVDGDTRIDFRPKNVTVYMGDTVNVSYTVLGIGNGTSCYLYSNDPHIADLKFSQTINSVNQTGVFILEGNFLGDTFISCRDPISNDRSSESQMYVRCLRPERVIDTIFTASTVVLVTIIYVNFGCAVEWGELRKLLKRPIGPIIAFSGQFILMPLVTFGLGFVLFPNDPAMRLGMFFVGVSPGGGASNIWTAILDGNIDLSILMSTVSTLAAFGMMPLWLFTLGGTIFADANTEVPYFQISTYVMGLIFPLTLGYLIQRYLKKFGSFLKRILKGFSSILILFIIVFAIVTNLYLFELFSWQIFVAGMVIPWMGYLAGYTVAKLLKQPYPDALAIAIEIGILNTGIPIFLLRFALDPLNADLTTVIPVSVAIMTPLPLMVFFVFRKIKQR
ncbi:unnamed protein product [Ceutorhynchus assimilis]|uniref:Ileal sodium/bile acid cotransporter n=1 Tax=Ceutorhynchus assimilis TaxID=467358 RepID=A0A9N9QIT2_9CUCU|nr:unnamed protein product [Ceutorhynchus assimilis]